MLNPQLQSNGVDYSLINSFLQEEHPVLWIAINHHITHKNKHITLDGHLYLKEIMMDTSPFITIMKATQCGVSEYLIVYTINDACMGRSVFYVLPTYDLMGRFVSNRFEKSLAYTEYYRALVVHELSGRKVDNRTLKDIGNGVVSFAGSNTPVPFTEFPADTLIIDEKDRCDQEHVKMGKERLGHSEYRKIIEVSNPTIPNFGIHESYKESDQKEWHVQCSHCDKWFVPDFFDNVVRKVDDDVYVLYDEEWEEGCGRDIFPICECGKPFDRFAGGVWLSQYQDKEWSGYHISKMFSGTVTLKELVENFNKGLSNDFDMQRFYNADLGLPFMHSGSKLSQHVLDDCIGDFGNGVQPKFRTVMGIDVGRVLTVRVNEILPTEERRAIYIGEVHDIEDIISLFKEYKCVCAVIDALPETRMAKAFSNVFPGRVFRCFFGTERKDMINGKDRIVTVDRTQMLDGVRENFVLKRIILPRNAGSIENYYPQLQASTRIWNEDKQKFSWEEGASADHYFLSEGYAEVAFKILKLIKGVM